MRPLDLLALKIDDDHKKYIREYHGSEKNFKISKQYEVYNWTKAEGQQSKEEKHRPKKVDFFSENEAR
jgi:hypothetical protein